MGLEAKLPITDDTIGSLLSSSDIDDTFHQQKQLFEESSEESDYPNQMRRKLEENLVSDVEETESIVQKRIQDISEIRDSKAPCNSESTSSSLPQLPNIILESDSELIKSCGYSLQSSKAKTNISSTPKDRCNSDGRIHSFVSRPAMHPEKCYFCCKTITFCKQVSKCSSCKMTCHPCCKERCPLPCIPIILPRRNFVGTITDYTSSTSPKIPSIIICCINEIESRGLKCIGLYRKSGYGRDVKILKENLLKGKIPDNLGKIDIHTICSALKEFLRSLKEPLITRSAWKILVDAANQSNENVSLKLLYDALCDLPQSNKETLAFLLLHLQKVAESTECKMPHENLAKVFGPTIIGYSTDNPPNSSMLFETGQQCLVMRKLLKIAADLWQNFLKDEKIEFLDSSQEKKPNKVKALAVSRFEPIYASVQKRKKSLTKKSHSPRIQRFS
ncbi:rac GTPase-activating protein 1 [Nephila pilipes]|uniref:Rac GTPase-activating protein 1 n=1 Tax=Nephila pilipes TaxID=299642 RepID=A0A8X6QAP2_NEPPI|nr:rac GTPase-activating protein 1 [Nephila pilipes]